MCLDQFMSIEEIQQYHGRYTGYKFLYNTVVGVNCPIYLLPSYVHIKEPLTATTKLIDLDYYNMADHLSKDTEKYQYSSGFHIFLTKPKMENYLTECDLFLVSFSNPIIYGWEHFPYVGKLPVVVAQQMTILERLIKDQLS